MNHVVAITKHKATVTITPVNCLASWASRGINFQQRRLLRRRFQINFISARLIFSLSLFIYLSISSFTFHSLRRFRESLPPRVLCVQHALFVEYVAIIDMTGRRDNRALIEQPYCDFKYYSFFFLFKPSDLE